MGKLTLEQVIKEIEDWSNTPKGKKHIQQTYLKFEKVREELYNKATLDHEKLKKFYINI